MSERHYCRKHQHRHYCHQHKNHWKQEFCPCFFTFFFARFLCCSNADCDSCSKSFKISVVPFLHSGTKAMPVLSILLYHTSLQTAHMRFVPGFPYSSLHKFLPFLHKHTVFRRMVFLIITGNFSHALRIVIPAPASSTSFEITSA